ncbi:ATP phosphoribosyltransferase regulatory subunit [Lacticaseibacillus parahuelsenbergensis]|uniref:ATP phosphoribosyltransferase regulatory subunit n=1 Tax=Lacticaseibacillus parahuelsenbergensis TaxID=3068305 RepID=A0ABY9L6C5_9LACO|nr:ATP phosphoribosyltransferase regulatory subunit [Lacticaseibacillus sp. NCIMB 15471]WLV79288.1 ATP phosphoribosyltransferase regulatory subunit [Lacticaseibacillus sp. NCIMB 15471]
MSNRHLPVGTRDEFGPRAIRKENLIQIMSRHFIDAGFDRVKTPLLEYRDVFQSLTVKGEQPYQMLDDAGETVVMRPDLTLPLARLLSTTNIQPPVHWWYVGDIFRVRKSLSGTYNQITQAGIELIGYASLKAEWACLNEAIRICNDLKVGDLTLELSDARFVPQILQALALDPETEAALQTAFFAKNLNAYERLIEPLAANALYPFLKQWPWLFGPAATVFEQLRQLLPPAFVSDQVARLQTTVDFLKDQFPDLNVTLDLTSQPPQSYYTGLFFHAYVPNRREYLFSGGRYDRLMASFQRDLLPAVGLAFDVDALTDTVQEPTASSQTFVYSLPSQWQEAAAVVATTPNARLCLVDSLAEARALAKSRHARLIDLSPKEATL